MYFVHPQFKGFKLFLKKVSEAKLKQKLANFFPNQDIIFIDFGRSAFQVAIQNLKLENSEMLVPAYICDIFLPIFKHYNIKPIYLDIDLKTFNINPYEIDPKSSDGVKIKITPKTKSILVCHTYGNLADMNKILEIAKKHNLKVIEDCAHIFPIRISGDCAFFSFSKIMPTINGGMLICKKEIRIKILKYKGNLFNIIKFARLFPIIARVSEIFRAKGGQKESRGLSLPKKISKRALRVFNWYLDNFEERINKRTELAKYFQEKLQKLGFQTSPGTTYISALVPRDINRDELFNKIRKHNIFCSRIWYRPICPNLPNTTEAAKRIINFPLQNWFDKKDIDKMVKIINGILQNND